MLGSRYESNIYDDIAQISGCKKHSLNNTWTPRIWDTFSTHVQCITYFWKRSHAQVCNLLMMGVYSRCSWFRLLWPHHGKQSFSESSWHWMTEGWRGGRGGADKLDKKKQRRFRRRERQMKMLRVERRQNYSAKKTTMQSSSSTIRLFTLPESSAANYSFRTEGWNSSPSWSAGWVNF